MLCTFDLGSWELDVDHISIFGITQVIWYSYVQVPRSKPVLLLRFSSITRDW
jgi:hypothetical protein